MRFLPNRKIQADISRKDLKFLSWNFYRGKILNFFYFSNLEYPLQ